MKEVQIYNSNVYENYSEEEIRNQIAENLEISKEEVTQDMIYEDLNALSEMDYDCEKANLNRKLDNNIICIASSWNRYFGNTRHGYKVIGNNLNDILQSFSMDEIKIYADRYNVKATGYDHDCSHDVIFRELRPNRDIDKFIEKIWNNEVDSKTLSYYTKSLRPYIKEVYGV